MPVLSRPQKKLGDFVSTLRELTGLSGLDLSSRVADSALCVLEDLQGDELDPDVVRSRFYANLNRKLFLNRSSLSSVYAAAATRGVRQVSFLS